MGMPPWSKLEVKNGGGTTAVQIDGWEDLGGVSFCD